MDLDTYLRRCGRGSALVLANKIKVSPVLVSMWRSGRRAVPAEHCPVIERVTDGDVRCEDLRPDIDWGYLRICRDFGEVAL